MNKVLTVLPVLTMMEHIMIQQIQQPDLTPIKLVLHMVQVHMRTRAA